MGDPELLTTPIPGQPATGIGNSSGTTTLQVATVNGTILIGSVVTGTGVPANTTIVRQIVGTPGGSGQYTTSAVTTLTTVALTFTPSPTIPYFPEFIPPSPPVAAGNPPPPAFPPPAIPVVAGPLGGPLFTSTGTSHPSPSYTNPYVFPGFSVTLLNPPITVSNVLTVPTYVAGPPPHWTSTLPAYIVTTPPMPHLAELEDVQWSTPPAPASLSAAATPRRGRRRASYASDLHN